ncbi:MAG: hypothetical protein OXH78_04320 [Acidimicrobiaceae bacterium]|nr:hypothetical protein [Acidimicrobiaceae bacterium]
MPVRKWSISVDEKLAEHVELRAGRCGLSGFVARAVANELERDRLDDYLETLDQEFEPVPVDLLEHYNDLWPS